MYWLLAWQALRTARTVGCTSAALVCVSVVCVVGAERSFGRLAQVVEQLADGGMEHTATVDVSRCASCVRLRRESPLLQHTVAEVRVVPVRLYRVAPDGRTVHHVSVHCLPVSRLPRAVKWSRAGHAAGWSDAVGVPTTVVGAKLAGLTTGDAIHTSAGVWQVTGHARPRPPFSIGAGENDAILVPDRPPFAGLCATGTPWWRLSATDSSRLQANVARTTDELRTVAGLRPGERAPWNIQRNDGLARVARRLVARFRGWVLLVPIAIALLCGAGVFGVQTLQSEQRIAEFGVRRAVGASRTALIGQLLAESSMTALAGVITACALLHAAGLLGSTASGVWQSLGLAVAVAVPLAVIGLLIPGLAALRASSIAQLEGRSP